MLKLWACTAGITLIQPMNVPGYPKSKDISVQVKIRTEGDKEPSEKAIQTEARHLIDTCYDVEIASCRYAQVDFLI